MKRREEAQRDGRAYIPGRNAATIPFEEMGTPEEDITTRIGLTDDEFAAKLQAVRAHATQLPASNPWTRLEPDALRAIMGAEAFQLVPEYSDRQYPTPEDDLFAGL